MDIQQIKKIVNSGAPEGIQAQQIVSVLAKDKKVIPLMMDILNAERSENKELVEDMNVSLSKSHIYIEQVTEDKHQQKKAFNKEFLLKDIEKFYTKYKSTISHCFNRFNN